MFENLTNQLEGLFGKVAPGLCRITMNGKIAVKCSNGYKAYNVETGRLTNVTNFNLNIGDGMFFIVPTRKAKVGDILMINGKPKCVTEVKKNVITVIDYENSEIRQVVPERHVFMGNTYFYGRIVSVVGKMFGKGKGMKNIFKMMMMSQILGGSSKTSGTEGGFMNGDMGQLMMMSMMFGGNNFLDGMFDFNFGDDEEEGEEEETDMLEELTEGEE